MTFLIPASDTLPTYQTKVKHDINTLFETVCTSLLSILKNPDNYYNSNRLPIFVESFNDCYNEMYNSVTLKIVNFLDCHSQYTHILLKSVIGKIDSCLANSSSCWLYINLRILQSEPADNFRLILRQFRLDVITYILNLYKHVSNYCTPVNLAQIQSNFLKLENQCIFDYLWSHTLNFFKEFYVQCTQLLESSTIPSHRRTFIINNYLALYRSTIDNVKTLLTYGVYVAPVFKFEDTGFFVEFIDLVIDTHFVTDFVASDFSPAFCYYEVKTDFLVHLAYLQIFIGKFFERFVTPYLLFHEDFKWKLLAQGIITGFPQPPAPSVPETLEESNSPS